MAESCKSSWAAYAPSDLTYFAIRFLTRPLATLGGARAAQRFFTTAAAAQASPAPAMPKWESLSRRSLHRNERDPKMPEIFYGICQQRQR